MVVSGSLCTGFLTCRSRRRCGDLLFARGHEVAPVFLSIASIAFIAPVDYVVAVHVVTMLLRSGGADQLFLLGGVLLRGAEVPFRQFVQPKGG